MEFFWTKTPKTVKKLLRNFIWEVPNSNNTIYLTFDDGPIPEVTEWVLDILKEENIKATFFCIGDNIQKHPTIYQRILNEGHKTGNHTFNHLNGWSTKTKNYIKNFKLCENEIKKFQILNSKFQTVKLSEVEVTNSKVEFEASENLKIRKSDSQLPTPDFQLFRPPYGKMTLSQSKKIQKLGYKIVMWDVLSYDFKPSITAEKCKENVLKNTTAGSIIVFHDSIKAEKTLRKILPEVIQKLKNKGFQFDVLA
ncbi:polysaccharide deacetylase family protein [Flavobacterium tibetense]|uniref:Polysaccharide deacetylase family protein n=1 Tax=Flavobacterium tibetense TaxID=2233533 RepID=A0A365NZS5_9FLAO|nr:polysaccharide deacetylase family protein [Flavobacterium tibetense]RBA27765.1 polysaccharide deacetylase family protein [Flavobacterium tibetense]